MTIRDIRYKAWSEDMVRRQSEKTEVMVIGDKTSVIVMSSDGSYEILVMGDVHWTMEDEPSTHLACPQHPEHRDGK